MNFEELKAEAQRRGIVPGARCRSVFGTEWIVGPVSEWRVMFYEGGMYDSSRNQKPLMYNNGEWATVITPAPSQPTEGGTVSHEALDAMAVLYGRVMASEGYTGGTDIKEYHAKLREAADAMWNAIFPKP